jgi:hypothetical protein
MKPTAKIIVVSAFLAFCSIGLADELLVSSQYPTIQSAIDAAVDGDTVIVAPGTYTGDGNRDIDFLGKAITVRSTDPNDLDIVVSTIIDCNKEVSHRGFSFHSGETPSSILSGLTITNGDLSVGLGTGAGIYCERCSPTIKNCIVTDNSAGSGGGIACLGGSPRIINCTISNNRSRSPVGAVGGGVWSRSNSSAILTNCIISGNSANYGGGISCWEKNRTEIRNCTIVGNFASYSGGGIDSYTTYSQPIVSQSILWDNSSDVNGPEVSLRSYQPSILMFTYSNVEGGLAAMDIETGSSVIWRPGNIDADPCFVDPGHWVDANDPNIIVEPNDPNAVWFDGDYHLRSKGWRWDITRQRWTWDDVTSRCIDAGNPGSPLGDELLSVPDDPNNEWGENLRINMGAFGGTAEASIPPYDWALLSDLTNDGLVDLVDYAYQAADWLKSADQQPGDLNRDSFIDIFDLALLVEDWLEQTTWH